MKKHLLTLVAAMLCVLSASADFTVGNLTYTTVGSDAWCTGMSSSAISSGVSIVYIPPYVVYNGTSYPVTAINNTSSTSGPFAGNTRITEVYIGPNVKTIGFRAFYNCTGLKTVFIYGDVSTIADVAFGNCTSLDNVYTAMTTANGNSSAFDGAKSGRAVHTLRGAGFSDLVAAYKASNCWKGFKYFYNNFGGGMTYNYNSEGTHYFRVTSGPKSSSVRGTMELIDVEAGTTKVQPGWGLNYTSEYFRGTDVERSYYNCTSINDKAFRNNTTITSIDLSGAYNLTDIANYTFQGCTKVNSITLGEGLKRIGYAALDGTIITTITLPKSYATYNTGAFNGCLKLTEILTNADNPYFSSSSGFLYNKNKTVLYKCPSGRSGASDPAFVSTMTEIYSSAFYQHQYLEKVDIPYGVTTIGEWAFGQCPKLVWAKFPSSVTTFGNNGSGLFYNDTKLARLYMSMGTVPTLSDNTFYNVPSSCKLYTGYDYTSNYKNASFASKFSSIDYGACDFVWNNVPYRVNSTTSTTYNGITFAGTVRVEAYINPGVYQSTSSSATTGSTISIGTPVWRGKTYLCKSVNNYAFSNNTVLTTVNFPTAMQYIYGYSFFGCSALTAIDLGNTDVSNIYSYAFSGCSKLSSITWPKKRTLKQVSDYAFYGIKGPYANFLPYGVTSIGNYAFAGNTSTFRMSIPSSVTSLGKCFAKNCTSMQWLGINTVLTPTSASASDEFGTTLKSGFVLDLPSGTVTQGYGALSGISSYRHDGGSCDIITSGRYGDASKDNYLFFTVTTNTTSTSTHGAVTKVMMPSFVATQGVDQFFGEKLTLPSSISDQGYTFDVTALGVSAFEGATPLRRVQLPSAITSIPSRAFYGCGALNYVGDNAMSASASVACTLKNVTSIGSYAFYNDNLWNTLDLSENLTTVGEKAFAYNPNLYSLVFRHWVSSTSLGNDAWGLKNDHLKVYAEYRGYTYFKSRVKNFTNSSSALAVLVPYVAPNHPKYRGAAVDANLDLSKSKISNFECYYVNYYDKQKNQALTTQINGAVAAGQGFIIKNLAPTSSNKPGDKYYPMPLATTGYTLPGNMLSAVTESSFTTITRQTGLDYYELGSNGIYSIKTGGLSFYANSYLTVNSSLTGGVTTIPLDLEATLPKGDVNGDGVVSATDIACIVNVLAGLEPASKYEGRADVNGDNAVTSTDIAEIVNILAGLG